MKKQTQGIVLAIAAILAGTAIGRICAAIAQDPLVEQARTAEQEATKTRELAEAQAQRIPGDLDGDGDVDDADLSILYENWTGPAPTPGPGPDPGPGPGPDPQPSEGFTPIDLAGATLLPASATLEQVQAAIDGDGTVAIAAGTHYKGTLKLPDSTERIAVHGQGPRPIIEAPAGARGIEINNDRIEQVVIQGLDIRGPPERGTQQGIRLRITNKADRYAKSVVISDCRVSGFDTAIEIVDDWARSQKDAAGNAIVGQPGRIALTVERCMIGPAYGSDSHSIGLYLEGLQTGEIRETTIDHAGWRPGHPEDRNKRSHGIYGQSYNGPIAVKGCIITRAAANALQLRAGGSMQDSIISECGLGPWLAHKVGPINGNLILDQIDIAPDEIRGHGFIGGRNMSGNIAVRRNGSQASVPAFKGISAGGTFENNTAAGWHKDGLDFEIGSTTSGAFGTNRVLPRPADDVLRFDQTKIEHHLSRPRGVWADEYSTAPFITAWRNALKSE